MKILILHRVPYFKIEYHRGISHDLHDVTYFGTDQALATLPDGLRCERASRPGTRPAFEEARDWLANRPRTFDRVLSISEYELLDAALLREHLGAPGAPAAQVALSRDKVLMKQAVENAGLRVPRFLPLPDFLTTEGGTAAAWHGPTVLKPHRGASSEDVLVYDTPAQAAAAVTERRTGIPGLDAGKDLEDFQVEEFVTGPIRHFDGLVQGGEVLLLSASEYVGTCLRYAQGSPLGSFQTGYSEQTRTWVARALAAVRIEDGSFHLEAIVHDGELVFLEVGNRVGGADVVATVELATGVHLPSYELRALLGEPIAGTLPKPPTALRRYGWFVYPGHHLAGQEFRGLEGATEFREAPAVVAWNELPAGTPLPRHITYQSGEAVLTGIVASDTPEGSRDWITGLFDTLTVRTRPAAPTTPEQVLV
ncbi:MULTISPECIES: acetyl-CoA carboxylase biotin carboxylase subunit family protein [unclassified Streptomyces]|uniref:ATP-grasp domain-containing protein n=1 Tax=unclassified Streptomyces TaxID=2593676 RepID=UPI00166055CB|nr:MULTISPECIES: ATP-grasp domain-containing protein [unclassified Streptomyces]MBD0711496.1 ATP-grasp domain-containing protein [Streptomyces sp. CBMA291]MBD0716031.1 ATP-grasp domain-containing protein [Streptomyces sp. CBMA370]